jgi:hypothetical protein
MGGTHIMISGHLQVKTFSEARGQTAGQQPCTTGASQYYLILNVGNSYEWCDTSVALWHVLYLVLHLVLHQCIHKQYGTVLPGSLRLVCPT